MKRKTAIIIGSVTLLGAVGYMLINRAKKKKEIDAINAVLDNAVNESGQTVPSVKQAFDPLYWQDLNKSGKTSMQSSDAQLAKDRAKTINDSVGVIWNDKSAVLGVFSVIESRAKVSMMNDAFITAYKKDIRGYLQDNYSPDFNRQIVSMVAGKKEF